MQKFNKRFSQEEFKKELVEHLKSKPLDLTDEQLEKHAATKAEHYAQALAHIDHVSDHLKKIAANLPDEASKTELDLALKKLDEAIEAYGEASLSFNNSWQGM